MARREENTGFVCGHCGARVPPVTNGSYRNHCPFCLWSLHVDGDRPGDRLARCRGLMAPEGYVRTRKGFQIIHVCTVCGKRQRNRVALDTEADDMDALIALMQTRALSPP